VTHKTKRNKNLASGFGAALGAVAFLSLGGAASASVLVLDPLHPGTFGAGTGATASFAKIDDDWLGSTVLWDEVNQQFGSGQPISDFAWGTGIWGLADWQTVQASLAGGSGPAIVASWAGTVPTINFADDTYNLLHAADWGAAELAPLFTAGGSQDNWISHFSGYVRITTPGVYSFSVLNDDGFFLRLSGQAGQTVGIQRDFLNPRERSELDVSLQLAPGLYGFELGAWDRIEAGVVDLRWMQPGSDTWTLIPVENLLPVPEPTTRALAVLGVVGLLLATRRLRRKA
jgi:hypothetical protein